MVNLWRLAGPDHELTLAAVADFAGDRVVEEAVLEPIDDEPFETVEGFADLPAGNRCDEGAICASAIV